MRIYAVVIVFIQFTWIHSNYVPYCDKSSKQPHAVLKKDLLCDYDQLTRPKMDHQNATKIFVILLIQSFIYDTLTHMLTVNAWVPVYWEDEHLKWEPSDYQDISEIHIESDSIWTPDLSIYNRYHQSDDPQVIGAVDCLISNVGAVLCISPAKFDTVCTADLTNFPFDTQTCNLDFGSWAHSGEELDMQFSKTPFSLTALTPNPEWDLLHVTYKRDKGVYDCCPNTTHPKLVLTFTIQRRSSFHEATLIIASLGLLVMCLLAQFMDVREIERFALTTCNIISHIMFMQYVSWKIPSVGDSVPRIVLFGRDSLMILFVQLFISIILRNLTKTNGDNPSWMSDVISRVLQSRIGHTVLGLDFSMEGLAKVTSGDDSNSIIAKADRIDRKVEKDCMLFAKLIDRLCFVIFSVTYSVMFISLIM